MSRAAPLDCQHLRSCALVLTLFLFAKRARLFPSAAYRRSAPAQLAVGILTPCRLGCFDVAGRFCGVDKWAYVLFPQSAWGIRSPCRLGRFHVAKKCNAKGQREFEFTLAFVASHEACRRMAVYAIQAAGSCTRPASREACRRAAVASRPSRMSREQPRAQRARSLGAGQSPA